MKLNYITILIQINLITYNSTEKKMSLFYDFF